MNINQDSWELELYEQQFAEVLELFLGKIKDDPTFTIDELQKHLDLAYMSQEDNWIGNGRVWEVKHNARVAALEMVMYEWKQLIEDEQKEETTNNEN